MTYSPRDFRALWPEFAEPSWQGWAAVEDAVFGLEPSDPELVRRVTGRDELPSAPVSELWAIVGRGGGKSRWIARLAVFYAVGRQYKRAPGEQIYAGIFGPSKAQAAITARYVSGLLHAVPALERMIVSESIGRESAAIELDNGVVVEVLTASKASPRGRAYCLAVVEEGCYLPQETSTDPDKELIRAIRPGTARVPGSLLAVVSSPYARKGEVYKAWKRHFGKPSPSVLVLQADTRTMNPAFDPREIERAYEEDPIGARAEYGAMFREDVETYISREIIEAAVVPGRQDLPPVKGIAYKAFADLSGARVDSAVLAIGHNEDGAAVVDVLREIRAPYSPARAVETYAELLRSYGLAALTGDNYAGEWPVEAFRGHGITYTKAAKAKGDLYRDSLALLLSGRVELPDSDRLLTQFTGLERRVGRSGRDVIDHAPNAHDDLPNAVAGLVVGLILAPKKQTRATWGRDSAEPGDAPSLSDLRRQRLAWARRMEHEVFDRPPSMGEQLAAEHARLYQPAAYEQPAAPAGPPQRGSVQELLSREHVSPWDVERGFRTS